MNRKLLLFFYFFGWSVFGQLLISLIYEGALHNLSDTLLLIGQFLPSVSRMSQYAFFDFDVAQRYTVLMLFLTPVATIFLGRLKIQEDFLLVKKEESKKAAGIFLFVGLLPVVVGFGYSIFGLFLRSFILYAFLVSSFVFLSAYCIRAAIYLIDHSA